MTENSTSLTYTTISRDIQIITFPKKSFNILRKVEEKRKPTTTNSHNQQCPFYFPQFQEKKKKQPKQINKTNFILCKSLFIHLCVRGVFG